MDESFAQQLAQFEGRQTERMRVHLGRVRDATSGKDGRRRGDEEYDQCIEGQCSEQIRSCSISESGGYCVAKRNIHANV